MTFCGVALAALEIAAARWPSVFVCPMTGKWLRLLERQPPDLEEARQALAQIVQDGIRAGAIVDSIHALIKKAPSRKERLDINEAIHGVIKLTRGEAVKNGVSMQTKLAEHLPLIQATKSNCNR